MAGTPTASWRRFVAFHLARFAQFTSAPVSHGHRRGSLGVVPTKSSRIVCASNSCVAPWCLDHPRSRSSRCRSQTSTCYQCQASSRFALAPDPIASWVGARDDKNKENPIDRARNVAGMLQNYDSRPLNWEVPSPPLERRPGRPLRSKKGRLEGDILCLSFSAILENISWRTRGLIGLSRALESDAPPPKLNLALHYTLHAARHTPKTQLPGSCDFGHIAQFCPTTWLFAIDL